jgi:hypothetical protein
MPICIQFIDAYAPTRSIDQPIVFRDDVTSARLDATPPGTWRLNWAGLGNRGTKFGTSWELVRCFVV